MPLQSAGLRALQARLEPKWLIGVKSVEDRSYAAMCHVLVIEDDFLIADYIVALVEQAGAKSVDQAATEAEAIEAARRQVPAIILSDVKLLEGTGPAAVQRIIAEHGDLPVIFITGTPEACEPCNPPMVVLTKPIEENALLKTFAQLAPL